MLKLRRLIHFGALSAACTLFFTGPAFGKQDVVTIEAPAPPESRCPDIVYPEVEPDPHLVGIFDEIYHDPAISQSLARSAEILRLDTLETRPRELIERDLRRIENPGWLLHQIQLSGYVNSIGRADNQGTFATLAKMLPILVDRLGVTGFSALPFMESPFLDGGYDVKNFYKIDPRFGGDREFRAFMPELRSRDATLQGETILNHISDQSELAKRVRAGDRSAYKFFHVLEKKPVVQNIVLNGKGEPMSAEYWDEVQKKWIPKRVIFPHAANPEHPHYVHIQDDNGKDLWIYQTFYPHQWDLNYENPEVLLEAMNIVAFWANLGLDIQRLDAIPFLFKTGESDSRTFKVVEALRYFLAQISPGTALLDEANQPPADVYRYFGNKASFNVRHLGKTLKSTSIGQIGYNFLWMDAVWASLISGDNRYFLRELENLTEPPEGAAWAYFLRNHDELTLEMPDEDTRFQVNGIVRNKDGVPFRGDQGIGGRTASFLKGNPWRVIQAYSLVLSMRGVPIIYYGDEIMTENNLAFAQAEAKATGQDDGRYLGRGGISRADWVRAILAGKSTPAGMAFHYLSRMIKLRKERISLTEGLKPVVVPTGHRSAIAYTRTVPGRETTLAVSSISDKPVTFTLGLHDVPDRLFDLIEERDIEFRRVPGGIALTLQPNQVLWIDLPPPGSIVH